MRTLQSLTSSMLRWSGLVVALAAGNAAAQGLAIDHLRDQAARAGAIRVIVSLDVDFLPEGRLPDAAARGLQRRQIASAQSRVLRALRGTGARELAQYLTIPHLAVEVDAQALDTLSSLDDVTAIVEDVPVPPTMSSSNTVIGSHVAWANGYTGAGQAVAILDSGVDKTHAFFTAVQDKVVSEACFSSNSGVSFSVCPDGSESSVATGSGIDCTAAATGYTGAQNSCRHGTHVAGSAAGNNDSGPHYGVARDADIIAIQIFSVFPGYCNGQDCLLAWSSDQISALERVYALRDTFSIAAVNMSLGGGGYSAPCDGGELARKQAMDNLASVGIATVVAAGNNGYRNQISAPACISTAISVGATTDADAVASFSNVADYLDVFAPGTSITSAVPGGGLGTWNGTSMATPHVTGAWAILKQVDSAAPVAAVLAALQSTGTPVDDLRSSGTVIDIPRINVDFAAAALQPTGSTLEFLSASYSADESDGLVILEVGRSGSSVGTVAVSYATADGSALAGQDYVAASGTLTWVDGDMSPKSIEISIVDDSTPESALETFSVTLAGASGADVSLGSTTSASVSIADNDALVPATPELFSATDNTDGTATLVWSDVTGETTYTLERQKKHKKRDQWNELQQVGTTAENVTTFTDQSGSGTFRWRVRAENLVGTSPWSPWLEAMVSDGSGGGGGKPCKGRNCNR